MTLRSFPATAGGEGMPEEPDWRSIYRDELDIQAAEQTWGIITREMREAGTLAVANGHAIRRLIDFRVHYDRSSRQVAEQGTVINARRTGVPQINPHWPVMRQAEDAIRSLEAELGVSPVRRSKAAKVQRGTKVPRPADAYLKPVPGGSAG